MNIEESLYRDGYCTPIYYLLSLKNICYTMTCVFLQQFNNNVNSLCVDHIINILIRYMNNFGRSLQLTVGCALAPSTGESRHNFLRTRMLQLAAIRLGSTPCLFVLETVQQCITLIKHSRYLTDRCSRGCPTNHIFLTNEIIKFRKNPCLGISRTGYCEGFQTLGRQTWRASGIDLIHGGLLLCSLYSQLFPAHQLGSNLGISSHEWGRSSHGVSRSNVGRKSVSDMENVRSMLE